MKIDENELEELKNKTLSLNSDNFDNDEYNELDIQGKLNYLWDLIQDYYSEEEVLYHNREHNSPHLNLIVQRTIHLGKFILTRDYSISSRGYNENPFNTQIYKI